MSKEAAFSTWAWEREIDDPDMRQTFYGGYTSRDDEVATLTREREEAIARAEKAELRVLELEEEVEVTSIELIQRADRAEAQLAEARGEAERLRAVLIQIQRMSENTDDGWNRRISEIEDVVIAALNPAADTSTQSLIQSAIVEDHDVLDAPAPIDGATEQPDD